MLRFFDSNSASTAIYEGTDLAQLSGSEIIALAKSKDSSYQKGIAQFIVSYNGHCNLYAKFSPKNSIEMQRLGAFYSFSYNAFLNACNTDGNNTRPVSGQAYTEENLAKLETSLQGTEARP